MIGKVCTKCSTEKPFGAYSTNSKAKDGKHSWCRECVNAQRIARKEFYAVRQSAWAKENRAAINTAKRARGATPEGKILKKAADARYVALHRGAVLHQKKLYGSAHPEKRRADYRKHKEAYVRRYYERKHKIEMLTPPDADVSLLRAVYNRAAEIGATTGVKHEVDHIVPISLGGLHHQDNLQILPWMENRSKGNRDVYCAIPRIQ